MRLRRPWGTKIRPASSTALADTGPIKGYSVCPYPREYNRFRVDAVARASEMTDHNGYTQTNSPFDFAGCIPRLPDRSFFLIDIS
jgi:hypothetical protein